MPGPQVLSHLKHRWIYVAIGALVFMLVPAASVWAVITFTDVPTTHTHYQGIQYVASENITTGYPDDTFRPDNPVTRGQMATFLYRASGNDPATPPSVNADKLDGKDAGQLVAAGIHVERGAGDAPVISKWFNNVTGVAPTISGEDGHYLLDVGFDTYDRFVVATIDRSWVDTRDAVISVRTATGPGDQGVMVAIWDIGEAGHEVPAEFYLMVF